jgi:hypothetical protein
MREEIGRGSLPFSTAVALDEGAVHGNRKKNETAGYPLLILHAGSPSYALFQLLPSKRKETQRDELIIRQTLHIHPGLRTPVVPGERARLNQGAGAYTELGRARRLKE